MTSGTRHCRLLDGCACLGFILLHLQVGHGFFEVIRREVVFFKSN